MSLPYNASTSTRSGVEKLSREKCASSRKIWARAGHGDAACGLRRAAWRGAARSREALQLGPDLESRWHDFRANRRRRGRVARSAACGLRRDSGRGSCRTCGRRGRLQRSKNFDGLRELASTRSLENAQFASRVSTGPTPSSVRCQRKLKAAHPERPTSGNHRPPGMHMAQDSCSSCDGTAFMPGAAPRPASGVRSVARGVRARMHGPHSCLSASIGSTRDARRAGR
jgi:hypothetical protein